MGKIIVHNKFMIENPKKRKYGNRRNFYTNLSGMEFTVC